MTTSADNRQTSEYRRYLYIVLGAACLVRLLAVIFARGYLAHDDFFETVRIAQHWANGNIWDPNGFLYWEGAMSGGLMRSPVYNLLLAGLLKSGSWLGLGTLSAQMVLVRSVHAAFSLLPVYYGFRFAAERRDESTALTAGLMLALFFPLPFLSVRTLIGVVAGSLMVPALYFADRAWREENSRAAMIAALYLGGIWIVRPPVEVVAAPIFFVLLGRRFRWRLALAVTWPVLLIALAGGFADILGTGRFMGALLNYMPENFSEPMMPGPWYRYLLLIGAAFIPPFSIWFLGAVLRPRVAREYPVWWWSVIVFVAVHSYYAAKQERFVFPILGPLIVVGVLAVASLDSGRWWGRRGFRRWLWGYFWVVNTALLVVFTFTYSHRGRVEPFAYMGEQGDARGVIVDCTKRWIFTPQQYAGYPPPPVTVVEKYPDTSSAFMRDTANYLVIFADTYPFTSVQKWNLLAGPWQEVHNCPPSMLDQFLEWINPKYNHSNRSWVFRRSASEGAP